jgi:hypothetical protein
MEAIARASKIISLTVQDPCKTILVLLLVNPSGRLLPCSEIEATTEMAGMGGKPHNTYQVRKETALPVPLTRKLFKQQQAQ